MAHLRVSSAQREVDGLDRLDAIAETNGDADSQIQPRKLVNDLNASYAPSTSTRWSLQYGAKFVFDRMDGASAPRMASS